MECGDPRLMFAALFHDIGKPIVKKTSEDGTEHFTGHPDESAKIAREVLLRLKVSTSFVEDVVYLVKIHDSFNQGFKIRNIRRFVAKTPKKQLERWLKLRSSDVASQAYFVAKTQNLKDVCDAVNQVLEDGTAITLSDLKINGNDILALGINDKRNIKHILNELLSNCYGSPSLNNRDWLMKYAAKLVKRCNNNPKWAEEHWLSKDNKK
jgi:tRNA nucleotidyltransferase (CCA-adding enzyme)